MVDLRVREPERTRDEDSPLPATAVMPARRATQDLCPIEARPRQEPTKQRGAQIRFPHLPAANESFFSTNPWFSMVVVASRSRIALHDERPA